MLDQLIAKIDDLPENKRRIVGRTRTGSEVMDALPSIDEFLRANQEKLAEAMFWGVTSDGRLVMGDGCQEPAPETLNMSYVSTRDATIRAAFLESSGSIKEIKLPQLGRNFSVTPREVKIGVGQHAEVIRRDENKLLWVRRLATPSEYREVNAGTFELNGGTKGRTGNKVWLQGGDDPHLYAPLGWYDGQQVQVVSGKVFNRQQNRGARRVLDHYLYFNE